MPGGVLTVALVQARRGGDLRENARRVAALAANVGEADVVFLSENWLSREPVDEEDYAYAVELVQREAGAPAVVAGANYVRTGEGVASVGLASVGGRVRRVCEKLFPSRAVGERGRLVPGRFYPPFEVGGWRVQCVVCVDIFYPEVARLAAVEGADIVYNPASIPSDRLDLWWSVLLARAAENTVYTVGVNGVSYVYPDGRITLGGSTVFAPNGVVLGRLGPGEEAGVFHLPRTLIERVRQRWAFHDDLVKHIARKLYRGSARLLVGERLLEGQD